MFLLISICFCLCSLVLILSPFWLAKNERIKSNIIKKEIEYIKQLKEETLLLWVADENNFLKEI